MSLFSRILWGLITLSLLALATVVLLVPSATVSLLNSLNAVHIVARFIIVIVLYVIVLAFLMRRMRQNTPVGEDYLMVNATGAVASITLDSVRERIQRVIRNIPDVDKVNVVVESLNGRCAITMDVHASEGVNVPEKHREIARAIEQVVKKQLGLKEARQPRVSLHLGEERLPKSSQSPAQTPAKEDRDDEEPRRFAGIFSMGNAKEDEKPKGESSTGATPLITSNKEDNKEESSSPVPTSASDDIDEAPEATSTESQSSTGDQGDDDETLPKF